MGALRALIPAAATVTTILSFTAATSAQTRRPSVVQQEPQPDIVTWLKSGDARLEAWGAWFAGAGQLRSMAPLIHEVVRQRVRAASPMNATLDIALDALIQMQTPLDRDLLPEVHAVRPAQALIAASFSKEADEFLDEVLQSAKGHDWYAAANLMLQRSPRALASRALTRLQLELTVLIVDPGTGSGIGSGGGGGVGCGVAGSAPGMPPWATYELTSFAAPGVTVLAVGPKAMYYRRTVAPAGQTPIARRITIGGPTADDRLSYAAAAAGIDPARLPLRGTEQHSISLHDDSDLPNAVIRVRADLTRRYESFLRMLVERGVLPEDAAAAHPAQIDIAVVDRRARAR